MQKKAIDAATKDRLILGLSGFEKISAVEGISLPMESRNMFARFERDRLTDMERRRAIVAKHTRKA